LLDGAGRQDGSMPRRLVLASLVAMLIVVPSAAHARTSIRVGIGDQNVSMFGQSAFERAKFKRVRYLVPWNVMDDAQQRLAARAYVKRARTAGMQLLLHVSTDDYRIKRARRPSVTTYRRQIGRIVSYFRALGVRDFGTWDEANNASQPTWDSPSSAALFFREMYRAVRRHCRTCGVVALDVLDQVGVERYMASFYRRLSSTYRRRATIVGIHNYGDVNRKRTNFTRDIIRPGTPLQPSHPLLADGDRRDRETRPLVRVQHRPRGRAVELDVPPRPPLPDGRHRPPLHLQLDGRGLRRALRRRPDGAGWRTARRLPLLAQGAPQLSAVGEVRCEA
jgi:hypothetical protein